MLEAEELAETVETLRAIGNLDEWLARVGDQFPRLGGLRQEVGEFSGLAVAIEGCLDNRGKVLDTASRRLSALRRDIGRAQERIQETLRQMLRSPEIRRILRFPNFTMVGHHYVLPVAKDHRGEVQGSVLRTSASNETVYVEPTAISEQSAQLSFLRAREAKEVRRILALALRPGRHGGGVARGHARHHGGARPDPRPGALSIDYRMSAPHFNQEGRLVLRSARHPLLEALFRSDPAIVVPPSRPRPRSPSRSPRRALTPSQRCARRSARAFRSPTVRPCRRRRAQDRDADRRESGTSISDPGRDRPEHGRQDGRLKTVGLLAIMAQAGLHVPAGEGSQFPIFDDVLTDIGDEQSLEQSLSTFSSHVGRIREILGKATPRSLVLLDELGAGTDPTDGAALGRAILDELDRIGCRAIVTTHIGDLKTYALSNPGAENAAVEFDDETFRPKYRLLDRRHRSVECAQDRAAVAAARARGRAGGGLPGPEPERRNARLGGSAAAAQGGRGGPRGGDRGAGRGRTDARSSGGADGSNCKRSRNKPTRSPRLALACSRATAWSSRGSATTARAGW